MLIFFMIILLCNGALKECHFEFFSKKNQSKLNLQQPSCIFKLVQKRWQTQNVNTLFSPEQRLHGAKK